MKRYEFKAGIILLGWCPVTTAIKLDTTVGTIMKLEEGDLDEDLWGRVVDRVREVFQDHHLAVLHKEKI